MAFIHRMRQFSEVTLSTSLTVTITIFYSLFFLTCQNVLRICFCQNLWLTIFKFIWYLSSSRTILLKMDKTPFSALRSVIYDLVHTTKWVVSNPSLNEKLILLIYSNKILSYHIICLCVNKAGDFP